MQDVCTKQGFFRVEQFNGVIQICPRSTFAATVTNHLCLNTKLAIMTAKCYFPSKIHVKLSHRLAICRENVQYNRV